MKRAMAILLVLVIVLTMSACGESKKAAEEAAAAEAAKQAEIEHYAELAMRDLEMNLGTGYKIAYVYVCVNEEPQSYKISDAGKLYLEGSERYSKENVKARVYLSCGATGQIIFMYFIHENDKITCWYNIDVDNELESFFDSMVATPSQIKASVNGNEHDYQVLRNMLLYQFSEDVKLINEYFVGSAAEEIKKADEKWVRVNISELGY